MLQAVHGFGIEQVELAFPSPLVLAASPQISVGYFFRVFEMRVNGVSVPPLRQER